MASIINVLCLAIILTLVSVDARRLRKISRTDLPSPDVCANVQSFEHLYKYTYSYDAIAETRNLKLNPNEFPSGIRIKCDDLVISVPNNCVGALKVSNCLTFQGEQKEDGSLIYNTPQDSTLLNKLLKKNPTYFQFNQGEIGKIFVDQTESADITNIKRAMLTALQLKFKDGSAILPLSKPVRVPEVSIFGTGEVEKFVSSYREGYPRKVNIERNMTDFHLPWSRVHSSFLHTPYTIATDALNAVGVGEVLTRMDEGIQTCQYVLERGRRITEATCVETRNIMFPRNTFLQPLLGDVRNNKLSTARVTLHVNFTGVEKMDESDLLRPSEIKRFRGNFKPDTLMFEEQWENANTIEMASFDVISVIGDLVLQKTNDRTPVLFSKAARYLSQAPIEEVNRIWKSISGQFIGDNLEKVTTLWVKLLHRCASATNLCYLPTCEPNLSCQTGLASFISTTGMHTWTPQIKTGILNALSSIEEPTILIVQSTLGICRAQTELRTVLTLGKVLVNHIATCAEDSEESTVVNALQFMKEQLNNDCTIQQEKREHEAIMLAVMNMLSVLPDETTLFIDNVVSCVTNTRVSKSVALAAARGLKHMSISDNRQVRTQILNTFSDSGRTSELRIACYLLLLSKEPTQAEVNTMVETAMDESQARSLRFFIKENIKSQVRLRETAYCRLSDTTMTHITNAISRLHLDLGFDWRQSAIREQPYEFRRSVFVPYLQHEVTCNFKSNLIFSSNSIIPILANVSVTAEIMNQNVTILESLLDIGGVMSSIEPLFGANGIFPDQDLQQFIKLPAMYFLDTEEWWPVSAPEANVLTSLQDEASMAYTILKMQNRSPVQIKLFNVPFDLTAILRNMDLRNINIMDLIQMLSSVEGGNAIHNIMESQILFGGSANPTSIGAPNLIQHDTSYYHEVKMNFVTEIRQLFFTGQGQISVQVNPDIRITSRISSLIELPKGVACGTGYQLSTGHLSNFDTSMVATATNIKFNLAPLPTETELFTATANVLTASNGVLEVVQYSVDCQPQCWLGSCNTGIGISYKSCMNPLDIGLFVNSNIENYYQTEISWGSMRAFKERIATIGTGLEIKINRKSSPTATYTPVFSCAVKYLPDLQELVAEWQVIPMTTNPWVLRANAFINRDADQLVSYFASMNITRPDESVVTRNYVHVNKLTEKPEPWFSEIMEYVIHHKEAEISPRYTITSEIKLPLVGDICTTGILDIPTTPGYKAHLVMKKGSLTDINAKKLFQFNATSMPTVDEDYEGFNSKFVIENLGANVIPYNTVKLNFYSAKDQLSTEARTSLHYELVPLRGSPFFVNSFSQYRKLEANRNVPFIFNTTLSSNSVQLQMDNYFANMSHILSENRVFFPISPLMPTQMMDRQAARIGKEIDMQSKMYKFYMEMYRDLNGDIYYALSNNIISQKSYSCGTEDSTNYDLTFALKPSICKYCYEVALNVPYAKVNSHWSMDQYIFDHQLSIDLHQATYPFYSYLPSMLYSVVDDRFNLGYVARYTIINDHASELELGYSYAKTSFKLLATETNVFDKEDPRIFNVLVSCDSCLPMTTFNTNFTISRKTGLTPLIEVPQPTENVESLLVINHNFVNGRNFNLVGRVFTSTHEHDIIDFRSSLSLDYPRSKPTYSYFILPVFDYRVSMNSTLQNVQTFKADQRQDFLCSFNVELGATSNVYQGTIILANQNDICPTQDNCKSIKVDISKISYCGPKSPKCARLQMNLIGTSSVYDNTVLITGRDDITTALNLLDLRISKTPTSGRISLDFEITEAQFLLPRLIRGNFSDVADLTELNVVTESTQLRWQRTHSTKTNIMEVRTNLNQLSVDCSATLATGSILNINVPRCSIAHPAIPSGEVVVKSSFTSRSVIENALQLNLRNNVATVLDVAYTSNSNAQNLKINCGDVDEPSSPCSILVNMNYQRLHIESRIQTLAFNHTGNADLVLNSLLQNTITTHNSVIVLGFPTELVINLSLPRIDQLSMEISANVIGVLSKHIRVRNSRLESVEMKSLRPVYSFIFSDNLEWTLVYTLLNERQYDFAWNLNIGQDTTLATALYLGPNSPDVSMHERNLPATAQIFHNMFNFTKCSSKIILYLQNIKSGRYNTDLLKSEMTVNVNVWPLVNTISLSYCPMCLGSISMNYEYNNIDANPTTFVLNALHAQKRQLDVQYSATINPITNDMTYACHSELSWPHSISAVTPKVIFTTNYVTNPRGSRVLKERIRLQGMPDSKLEFSEDLTIDRTGLNHELRVVSNDVTWENILVWNNEIKRVMFRFPDPEQPTLAVDITIRRGEIELRNCTVPMLFSRLQTIIERVQLSIIRNTLNDISGLRMTNLKLTAKDLTTTELISIAGNGQFLIGGECNLNIQDAENRYIRIVMDLQPGVPSTATSDIMLNLQNIKLNIQSHAQFSTRIITNNLNGALELLHPISRKMVPVFVINNDLTMHMEDILNARWVVQSDITPIWTESTPLKYSHMISMEPATDNTASVITVIVNWQDRQKISSLIKISNECWMRIPLYSDLTVCVPTFGSANGNIDLPMLASNFNMHMNKTQLFSNSTIQLMMWHAPTARIAPIWRIDDLLEMQRETVQHSFTGRKVIGMYTRWPMETTLNTSLKIVPTGAGSTYTYSWGVGTMDPIVIAFAPISDTSSAQRVTIKAVGRQILTATTEVGNCIDMPGTFSWLCIPSHFDIRQVNADIPTIELLRIIPAIKVVLPETPILDIILRDSSITRTFTMENNYLTMVTDTVVNCPSLTQSLSTHSTVRVGPGELFCSLTSNMWNGNLLITFNPTTTSMVLEANLEAPWLVANVNYTSPQILTVTNCDVIVKTTGMLATYVPININYHYTNNPVDRIWSINLRSCTFPSLMGTTNNVSLSIDNLMENLYFHWDTTSETSDLVNQLIDLHLRRAEDWNLVAGISNIFFWIKTEVSLDRSRILAREFVFGLPNQRTGISFLPSDSVTGNERFIIKWSDIENQKYVCRVSTLDQSWRTCVFNCFKIQERTAHTLMQELPIATFHLDTKFLLGFDAPLKYWIDLTENLRKFDINNLLDEKWLKTQCVEKLHVSEPELCISLSQYWIQTVSQIIERTKIFNLDSLMCSMGGNNLYTPVLKSYNFITSSMSHNSYVESLLAYNSMIQDGVRTWSNGMLTCGIMNMTDQFTMQCNVTCKGCGPMIGTVDLIMKSDSTGQPIANLTTTMPFMTSYIVFYYGLPIRPVTFAMRTISNEMSTRIDWDIPAETGFNSLTATWNLMDNGITCSCPKDESVILGISCTCHFVNNGIISEQEIYLPSYLGHLATTITHKTFQSFSLEQQITKYFNDGPLKSYLQRWSNDMLTYYNSVFKYYTMQQRDAKEIRIPIWRWNCCGGSLSLFADVDMTSLGVVMDITSERNPDLTQEIRMDIKNTDTGVMSRISMKNNFFWMTTDFDTSNLSYIGTSVGVQDSTERVIMSKVTGGIKVEFKDVEGSMYTCMLTPETPSTTRIVCTVMTTGSTTATPVSSTTIQNWWLDPQQLLMRIPMDMLETLVIATNPTLFKEHMRTTFHVTDMHSLDMICEYLNEKCMEVVNHFHNKYFSTTVNRVTEYLQIDEVDTDILNQIISVPELIEYLTGQSSLNHILKRNVEEMFVHVMNYAEQIYNQYMEVYRLANSLKLYHLDFPTIPYIEINTRNCINWFTNSVKKYSDLMYMVNKMICQPNFATPSLYFDMNYQDVLYNFLELLQSKDIVSRIFEISPVYHNQVINFQQKYYEFPIFQSAYCNHVASMDVVDKTFTFFVKPRVAIVALPRERVAVEFNLNREVYILKPDNSRVAIELPYFSDVLDIQVNRKQIHCRTSNVLVSLTYSDNQPTSFMQSVRIQKPNDRLVAGTIGAYSNMFDLPSLMIPDGSQATDLSQFANSYEISRLPQCIVTMEDFPDHRPAPQYCENIFSTGEMRKAAEKFPEIAESYKRACSESCVRPEETCWFTRSFASQLRSMGYPMNISSNCLLCNHEETPVLSNEVYILLSLSEEMDNIYPVKLLNKMLFKVLKTINNQINQETKIGLVTYGGKGSYYNPMLTTIQNSSLSNDIDLLKIRVREMDFNGPSYASASTQSALNFIHQQIVKSPGFVSKSLVVFTPEPQELSCSSLDLQVVNSLNEELTSVVLWSPVVRENDNNIILRTRDVCKTKSGGPSKVADLLSDNVVAKSNSRIQCRCYITNNYTGVVKNSCVAR